jgi:hypothetical protein
MMPLIGRVDARLKLKEKLIWVAKYILMGLDWGL